jgi:hypothetical protein
MCAVPAYAEGHTVVAPRLPRHGSLPVSPLELLGARPRGALCGWACHHYPGLASVNRILARNVVWFAACTDPPPPIGSRNRSSKQKPAEK